MGIFDKIKDMFGQAKDTASPDDVKDMAGKAKDTVDGVVDQHGDKIPDNVEKTYDKVSDAAEKVIPGDDAAAE